MNNHSFFKELAVVHSSPAGSASLDRSTHRRRETTRAVIDRPGIGVYLLSSLTTPRIFKLPGGSVEQDVDNGIPIEAVRRELIEEVGVEVGRIIDLGGVTEYRDEEQLTQYVHGFLTRDVPTVKRASTDGHKYDLTIASDLSAAVDMVMGNPLDSEDSRVTTYRDAVFLLEAISVVNDGAI